MATSKVWQFRILVFSAHIFAVILIIYLVASIDRPPQPNEEWSSIPLVQRFSNPEYLKGGEALYNQYCIACHGSRGNGGVGPALNDAEWIHGGTADDVIKSVAEGFPARGMAAWQPIMGTTGVEQVSAYVLSLAAD